MSNITLEDIKAMDSALTAGVNKKRLDPTDVLIRAGMGTAHITEMFHNPPGKTLWCGVGDAYLRITVEPSHMDGTDKNGWNIWDQVYIAPGDAPEDVKGRCAGNRVGGVYLMAALYQRELQKLANQKHAEMVEAFLAHSEETGSVDTGDAIELLTNLRKHLRGE